MDTFATSAVSPAAVLNASRCNIHMLEIEHALQFGLPSRYTPHNWEHNQYAVELWLHRAMFRHPWRVEDISRADVVFAAANFSMWCVAGKTFSRRRLWAAAFHPKAGAPVAIPKSASTIPVFVATQYEGVCGKAHQPAHKLKSNFIVLREEMKLEEFANSHQRIIVRPLQSMHVQTLSSRVLLPCA